MSAKPHFCLDCRKPVQAVWGGDPKRYLCAGLACPDCGSQKIEDMIIERRELLDCTAELHQRIKLLEEALLLYHEAWNGCEGDWRKAMREASENADVVLGRKRRVKR